ncbi:MAG: helix-turn-helix domain-containing protein [Roseovarius sp.]
MRTDTHAQAAVTQAAFGRVRSRGRDGDKEHQSKRFFKINEAVEYSGHSRSTLYEAHKRGDLIFTKFGGATRIEKADLDDFLDNTGVKVAAA